ncbi:velvet factor-domain-containing protein [Phellopilus nigrolimitatus]|nr:velvet factor-domain-containing protein [Phellopilus nigrolimitatus]
MAIGSREYELIVRQEPKQARMCGVGTKADRRPIDPPPVVQLRVIDKAASRSSSPDENAASHYNQSFLQNPYYFMYASLASPERDEELHLLKDGKTRCTTGSVVSSLYHLRDPEADGDRGQGRDAGFFVFPDLSVRTEGTYRLKLTLFEVIGANVHHCKSIFSASFYVYTAKKFPGMEESTNLSCALADQGIKIRIRKDVRVRKRTVDPTWFQPVQADQEAQSEASDDDEAARDPKRARTSDNQASGSGSGPPPPPAPPAPAPVTGTWNIDPTLAAPPPPPPPAGPVAPEPAQYDSRAYNPGPPPPPSSHPHSDYHPPPPPAHPHPHPHPHYMPPPPNGMYPASYGPPAPAPGWGPVQGYGAYHQPQPAYDHHAAPPASHQQHRGPPPPSQPGPYGAPAPMHYNAPPPYGYYDQHGQYIPPPQHTPPQASPRSGTQQQQSVHQHQQSQQPQQHHQVHPPPPPASYPAQDYGYARAPPAPASASVPPPSSSAPPHQQARAYQPAPTAQSAPAPYPTPPAPTPTQQQQQHMAHYVPPHQYAYAQGGDPYQAQWSAQQQYAQPPFSGGYGHAPRAPTWSAPPASHAGPSLQQADPYAHYPQQGTAAGGGYVRPGPEDGTGRRSPPVPSISSQSRAYAAASGSPVRGSVVSGVGGSPVAPTSAGAAGMSMSVGMGPDRIQLAPLRGGAGTPTPTGYVPVPVPVPALGRTNSHSHYGKKNPLSIGSIISDETG